MLVLADGFHYAWRGDLGLRAADDAGLDRASLVVPASQAAVTCIPAIEGQQRDVRLLHSIML